jgi:hypothetical protein
MNGEVDDEMNGKQNYERPPVGNKVTEDLN